MDIFRYVSTLYRGTLFFVASMFGMPVIIFGIYLQDANMVIIGLLMLILAECLLVRQRLENKYPNN